MPIKVLVVDDSFFMRTLISDMLSSDPEIEVIDTAKDGTEALRKIPETKPDCITLDLAMPGQDGLTTLKHIMDEYPTPVVILSAHSKKNADITINCLNAGAVGFVLKPSGELSLDIEHVKHKLLAEVKAASKVNVGAIKSLTVKKPKRIRHKVTRMNTIVVIGASTGGPQTLESILWALPIDFSAPIIVVQHMPTRFFTQSLAEHLNRNCELEVRVVVDNEIIHSGRVYLIPAGFRVTLYPRVTQDTVIRLSKEDYDILSPSVDSAMETVAHTYHRNAVGIILTGMGHDGVKGTEAIKASGGKTIVQDRSSLIFGMPKAVIEAGYADKVLPASEIASAIIDDCRLKPNPNSKTCSWPGSGIQNLKSKL
jgi:two-component system chemotaxis response regulator CheB